MSIGDGESVCEPCKSVRFGELVLVGDVGMFGRIVDVLKERTLKVSPVCLNLA